MAARFSIVRLAAETSSLTSAVCRRAAFARTARIATVPATRYYSTEDAPPPPLLVKLKGDLKMAMKTKDAARLSVLRAVLAATLNASKTAEPIDTDAKLVKFLRKSAQNAQDAAKEFNAAGRADLAEKEEAQIRVLEAYAAEAGGASMSKEELEAIAAKVVEELSAEAGAKPRAGDVIQKLLAPGGPLDGKEVNKGVMAQVVKQLLQ